MRKSSNWLSVIIMCVIMAGCSSAAKKTELKKSTNRLQNDEIVSILGNQNYFVTYSVENGNLTIDSIGTTIDLSDLYKSFKKNEQVFAGDSQSNKITDCVKIIEGKHFKPCHKNTKIEGSIYIEEEFNFGGSVGATLTAPISIMESLLAPSKTKEKAKHLSDMTTNKKFDSKQVYRFGNVVSNQLALKIKNAGTRFALIEKLNSDYPNAQFFSNNYLHNKVIEFARNDLGNIAYTTPKRMSNLVSTYDKYNKIAGGCWSPTIPKLNVRVRPTTKSRRAYSLTAKDRICTLVAKKGQWVSFEKNRRQYWVSSKYLQLKKRNRPASDELTKILRKANNDIYAYRKKLDNISKEEARQANIAKYQKLIKQERKSSYYEQLFNLTGEIQYALGMIRYASAKELLTSTKSVTNKSSQLNKQIQKLDPIDNPYKAFLLYVINKDPLTLNELVANIEKPTLSKWHKEQAMIYYFNAKVKTIKDVPGFISMIKRCSECNRNYFLEKIENTAYFAQKLKIDNFLDSIEYNYILKGRTPKVSYRYNNKEYSITLTYDKKIKFNFAASCSYDRLRTETDYSKYVDKELYYQVYQCTPRQGDIAKISEVINQLSKSSKLISDLNSLNWHHEEYYDQRIIANREQQRRDDNFCYSLDTSSKVQACLGNAYSTSSDNARNAILANCYSFTGSDSNAMTSICLNGKSGCYSLNDSQHVNYCMSCDGSKFWLRNFAAGTYVSCH